MGHSGKGPACHHRQAFQGQKPYVALLFEELWLRPWNYSGITQRGQPSSHRRTREIEKERQAKKKVDLYLQELQSYGQARTNKGGDVGPSSLYALPPSCMV